MRFRRKSPLLVLLLSSSILLCHSKPAPPNALSTDSLAPKAANAAAVVPLAKANPIGTEHAPVDGKDGMPHEGPFVETGADRSRKKADVAEEKIPLNSQLTEKFGGVDLPASNAGVMDDITRPSPADGTRGTEGGVSEKSRETKLLDKKPDAPKEAPPLPHSEAENVRAADGASAPEAVGDDKKPLGVRIPSSGAIGTC
jgi:Ca2+/H+ antiporter, TMEM165/GDT1 family